ncbi:DHH family phosphoesterase [Candidatus Bathyarchaeota archaeon]|nr:DHH family phosphoesterase [Candidatus Bathyarchaeota archaeon]
MQPEMERFLGLLGDRVIILCHHNADPDALGAAQGVKELVTELVGAETEIVLPDDASTLARYIASSLDISLKEEAEFSPDTIIVVDSGSLNQLGEWEKKVKKTSAKLIFIDHHLPDSEMYELSSLYLVDADASSASEIVYRLYEYHDVSPSEKTSTALLAGIAYDTKHFSLGGSDTFRIISRLLEPIGDVLRVKDILSIPPRQSEKIARLKAGQRAEVMVIGEWVLAFSRLGSFQSSGARALVSLGADLSVVAGEEGGALRASLRSTNRFYQGTRLHLGETVNTLAQSFNGSGSGHPTAAGFNGEGNLDEFMDAVKRLLREELEARS